MVGRGSKWTVGLNAERWGPNGFGPPSLGLRTLLVTRSGSYRRREGVRTMTHWLRRLQPAITRAATADQRGQTSAEYMGMLLVVAAILMAVVALAGNVGHTVVNSISSVFDKVLRLFNA